LNRKIRILIADDHPLMRGGISMTLSESGAFDVVAALADAPSAIAAAQELRPDMALLDISMPGGGLAAARAISAALPATRIAMLTVSESDDDVMAALEAGAIGYILKGVGGAELSALLQDIAAGQSYVAPSLAGRLLKSFSAPSARHGASPLSSLSKREENILRLVARGLSNREVGAELNIQEKTVKHYMTGILEKLHARNRVEAAMIAREGWSPGG
jgi:DNA-binding NarL/FixJ family response regulator